MPQVNVYDRPMCCSSGVCGPDVDPVLVRFSADLLWLARQGAEVERLNPVQQPEAFAGSEVVRRELGAHGLASLPLVAVDGKVVSRGRYPTRGELARWAGVPCPTLPELSVTKTGCCEGTDSGVPPDSSCC